MHKTACAICGVLILPATAARTGGVCMACKAGRRESLERSRIFYQAQRKSDRTDPERLYWKSLVHRVHDEGGGFETLSEAEQKYFATHVLLGEVFNGGLEQFFHNHSGEYHVVVSKALLELGALTTLRVLGEARTILFPGAEVPLNTAARRGYLAEHPVADPARLRALDKELGTDPDSLREKLTAFALAQGLIATTHDNSPRTP